MSRNVRTGQGVSSFINPFVLLQLVAEPIIFPPSLFKPRSFETVLRGFIIRREVRLGVSHMLTYVDLQYAASISKETSHPTRLNS